MGTGEALCPNPSGAKKEQNQHEFFPFNNFKERRFILTMDLSNISI
jgi:hypothetical protein